MPAAYLAPQSAIGGIGPGLRDAVAGYRDVTGADEERQKAAYVGQALKDQAEANQIKMKQIRAEESERAEKEKIGDTQHSLPALLKDQGYSQKSIEMLSKRAELEGITTKDKPDGEGFVKTKHINAFFQKSIEDKKFNMQIEQNELEATNQKISELEGLKQEGKLKGDKVKEVDDQIKKLQDQKSGHATTIFNLKDKIEQNAIATDQALLHKAGGDSTGIDQDTGQLNDTGKKIISQYVNDPKRKDDPQFRNEMAVYADSKKTGKDDYVKALHNELKEQAKMPLELAAMERTKVRAAATRFAATARENKSNQLKFADYFETLKEKDPNVTMEQAYDKFKGAGKKKNPLFGGGEKKEYKSADEVKADFTAGKIKKEDAVKILTDQFNMK